MLLPPATAGAQLMLLLPVAPAGVLCAAGSIAAPEGEREGESWAKGPLLGSWE